MAQATGRAAYNAAAEEAEALLAAAQEAEAASDGEEPPHEPRAAYNAAVDKAESLRASADEEVYEGELVSEVPAE